MKRQTGFCLGGDPDIDAIQIVLAHQYFPTLELLSKECPGVYYLCGTGKCFDNDVGREGYPG